MSGMERNIEKANTSKPREGFIPNPKLETGLTLPGIGQSFRHRRCHHTV